jgi:hypothetical protein
MTSSLPRISFLRLLASLLACLLTTPPFLFPDDDDDYDDGDYVVNNIT